MNTNDKLKQILMQIVTKPVESGFESGLNDISWTRTPEYDNGLEKIAHALVAKANRGDIKAIEKICNIIGTDEWRP